MYAFIILLIIYCSLSLGTDIVTGNQ